MNDTLEFLNKLNWILKPISSLVIFLFTTSNGLIILLLSFITTIGLSAFNSLKERKLAYKASAKDNLATIPFLEKIYLILISFSKISLRIIANLPVLLAVFVFLLMVVGFSKGIDSMGEFVQNQKKIRELQSLIKQLDKRYKVAEIEIVDYNPFIDETKLDIQFYDYANQGYSNNNQSFTIRGNDIYFDAIVLNFEYSEIANGNIKNIVLPYRVFSNKVSQELGIPLNIYDEKGIPFMFKRNKMDIYGMEQTTYNDNVKEILNFITDKEKARMAGIRSVYGNAVHKVVRKGDILSIWIEQTGGLVVKEVLDF